MWADGVKVKKPIKVSAPEYADYLMTWVQSTLEDETTFPVNDGITHVVELTLPLDTPFPKHFKPTVKNIFKRLFRIYAHIYYSHAQEVMDLGVEAHLNTAFKVRSTIAFKTSSALLSIYQGVRLGRTKGDGSFTTPHR